MKKLITIATIITAIAATPAQRAKGLVQCMTALDMHKAPDGIRAGTPARIAAIKAGADYGLLPLWRVRGKKKSLTGIKAWLADAWRGDPDIRICLKKGGFIK